VHMDALSRTCGISTLVGSSISTEQRCTGSLEDNVCLKSQLAHLQDILCENIMHRTCLVMYMRLEADPHTTRVIIHVFTSVM